jgi:hypothetical protein
MALSNICPSNNTPGSSLKSFEVPLATKSYDLPDPLPKESIAPLKKTSISSLNPESEASNEPPSSLNLP